MSSVFVDVDVVLGRSINISCNMVAAVNNKAAFASMGSFVSEYGSSNACANDEVIIMVLLHASTFLCMMCSRGNSVIS